MFGTLQEKLQAAFKRIRGRGTLSPADIESTLKDVRFALLEADVNFKVAKDFCAAVSQKASGEEVLRSLTPDQMVIKIVHEELVNMMGAGAAPLNLAVAPPAVIMLVGLQGSGKTTTAGKLALHLKKDLKRSPFLVPADVYRPAAIEQLKVIGGRIGVPVFASQATDAPTTITRKAMEEARGKGFDTVILDTAGRLQIDTALMKELQDISDQTERHEILLVVDAMTGQEAVSVAKGFDEALDIDGLIVTKLDGDARGGAALSMRAVTGKPIKFIGVGEKLEGLEVFHPERMASRILGMGDVLSLIEKAVKEVDVEDAEKLQKKMAKGQFGLDDFLSQMKMMRKMGSMSSLLGMMPGMDSIAKKVDPDKMEQELKKIEAMILSMTPKERTNPDILNSSRRKRITKGSGTSVEELNKFLKQFLEMKKMMNKISKMGMGGLGSLLGGKGMGSLFGKP